MPAARNWWPWPILVVGAWIAIGFWAGGVAAWKRRRSPTSSSA